MHTSELLKHIYDINLSYLLLAQRLIVQDKASAMFRLGISEEMADTLATSSNGQTGRNKPTGMSFPFRRSPDCYSPDARLPR